MFITVNSSLITVKSGLPLELSKIRPSHTCGENWQSLVSADTMILIRYADSDRSWGYWYLTDSEFDESSEAKKWLVLSPDNPASQKYVYLVPIGKPFCRSQISSSLAVQQFLFQDTSGLILVSSSNLN